MGKPRQKRIWVQVLVGVWGLSLPAGAVTPAIAEDAPAPPTLTLAGEPSIAFQGGYIKSSEPVSGVVVGARDFKQLFGMGDVLYIRVLPAANVRVGERLTLYRPSRQVFHPFTQARLGHLMVILGILQVTTETAYWLKSTDAVHRGDIVSRMAPRPSKEEGRAKEEAKAEGAPGAPMGGAQPTPPEAIAKVTPPEAPVPAQPLPQDLENVYFDFDKWALSDQTKKTLTAHAEFLKQNAQAAITIEGYADERGSLEYNRVLGEKRALEVRRFLTELGVSNPVTVMSFGKTKPICTEADEACYAKNRRVHLVIAGS